LYHYSIFLNAGSSFAAGDQLNPFPSKPRLAGPIRPSKPVATTGSIAPKGTATVTSRVAEYLSIKMKTTWKMKAAHRGRLKRGSK